MGRRHPGAVERRMARPKALTVAGPMLTLVLFAGWSVPPAAAQTPTIRYVQSAYATPQAAQQIVTASFPAAQSAGNLNIVAVGWNDVSAAVSSVSDSLGNAYAVAVGPTVRAGKATQSIYYAKSIIGG